MASHGPQTEIGRLLAAQLACGATRAAAIAEIRKVSDLAGSVSGTCDMLGIARSTLYRWARQYPALAKRIGLDVL